MNNILTEEEIANMSVDCALASPSDICFARKLESAILAKLAEGQEAVANVAWGTGGVSVVWPNQEWPEDGTNLYLHPSAELAALRAEVTNLKAKLAAARLRDGFAEMERDRPSNTRIVFQAGLDPYDPESGAVKPMVVDSWRFSFTDLGENSVSFGWNDHGQYVAYGAVEALRAEVERLSRREQYLDLCVSEGEQQLAAAQAREHQLREALENHSGNYKLSKAECAAINNLLYDKLNTSALDEIKAGYEARIEQWRSAAAEFYGAWATGSCDVSPSAAEIFSLPADRSALDAYLAPYKLDAERYRHLRELPKEQAQAYFWNYTSRKQRDKAIDAAIAAAKEKKSGECKHCNGKGVSQISDPCICQFGQKGGAA